MQQNDLTRIADDLANGAIIEGWAGTRRNDQEYLRSKVPNTMWWRALPSSEWFVVTPYEAYTDGWRLVPRPDHPIQPPE